MAATKAFPSNPDLRRKDWPWWHATFGQKLTVDGRQLLEAQGVRPEDVEGHIYRVRDEAWEIFPFPCIGEFWFLEFGIKTHPRFWDIVNYLKSEVSDTKGSQQSDSILLSEARTDPVVSEILAQPNRRRLLDLGTCIGQDLRAFKVAGAPTETLYGSDVFPAFEKVGHSFFLDEETFKGRFFTADVFAEGKESPLNVTSGCWDVVTMTMFLHQFDKTQQNQIAARAVRLLRKEPGSMIVGANTGQTETVSIPLKPPFAAEGESKMIYRQSRDSMREFWRRALLDADESGDSDSLAQRWHIWCEYDENATKERVKEQDEKGEVRFFQGGQQRRILFCIRRL